jgi:hypothetical protein
MQLRTYTGLWGVEKRLYKIYDISLPYPVSLKQLGIFLVSAVVWWLLLSLFGVPFAAPWHAIWLVPPFVFAWLANQPVAEGKTLTDFLLSNIKFYMKSRTYADFTAVSAKPEKKSIRVAYWVHSLRKDA